MQLPRVLNRFERKLVLQRAEVERCLLQFSVQVPCVWFAFWSMVRIARPVRTLCNVDCVHSLEAQTCCLLVWAVLLLLCDLLRTRPLGEGFTS